MKHFSLESLFGLKASGTTVKQEVLGGLTTFVAMSYLIFVVPAMLADAGMNREAATAATILVTVSACALMGLYANLPIAIGPGLGISAYFAYYICGPAGYTWQAGLAAVFISGVVFFILTVTRIRQLIIEAIPPDLKTATSAGIGCFIALVGMKNCGLFCNGSNDDPKNVCKHHFRNPAHGGSRICLRNRQLAEGKFCIERSARRVSDVFSS